jgi:hypothetical protein
MKSPRTLPDVSILGLPFHLQGPRGCGIGLEFQEPIQAFNGFIKLLPLDLVFYHVEHHGFRFIKPLPGCQMFRKAQPELPCIRMQSNSLGGGLFKT